MTQTVPTLPSIPSPPSLSSPDPAELRARAARLVPVLAQRRDLAGALRRVPKESIEALHELGLFLTVQPALYGGYEMDPLNIYELQLLLARGCASTAWVFGVLSVHTWQLALFEKQAQDDVWGTDRRALIASSYMPVGKTERVPGGVKLSGRWSFSSGIDHCHWVMLGGFAEKEEGGGREMMTFLVPREDFVVHDDWHVTGLRASGSKDVEVRDAFVPAHRLHRFADGYRQSSPGNAIHPSPSYRYPFGQVHVRCVSTPALGALQGALDACCDMLEGDAAALDPSHRLARTLGHVTSVLDREVLTLRRNFREMRAHLEEGTPIPIARRVRFRSDSATAVDAATRAIDELYAVLGEPAIHLGHPVNQAFQDIHAIRLHHANGPDAPVENLGRVLLGHRSADGFV